MNLSVLLTGSNGFIAGHVCRYLRERDITVIGMGRHSEPANEVDGYVSCNLLTDDVSKCIKESGYSTFDAVLHLAADMRHEPYTVDVAMTNCGGTQKLLEFCEETKVPRFMQLSSLPVIGKPLQHPITEDHPIKPPTVYHVTKRTQELLANYANYTFGVQTMSFRISAPVGPGMNVKTIFPTFVRQALAGSDITLIGRGTRKQTYIHVTDIAQALYKGLFSAAGQGVYNLSSNNLFSNYELAQKCVDTLHSQSKIIFLPKEDPMDDYIWDVSLEKIENDLGYVPNVEIEDAIREYAAFLQK